MYLPASVSGTVRQKNNIEMENKKISKVIFTLILTPAALITIISGTLVFVAMKIQLLKLNHRPLNTKD